MPMTQLMSILVPGELSSKVNCLKFNKVYVGASFRLTEKFTFSKPHRPTGQQ